MRLELLYKGTVQELPHGAWLSNAECLPDGEWLEIYCDNVVKVDTWGNGGADVGEPCTTADVYFKDGSQVTLNKLSNVTCRG